MADGRDAGPGWRRLHLEAGDVNLASGASTLEVMEGAHRYNRWIYDRVREGLGQRVLEIGCGTGTITSFMVDRQLVVGIDVVDDYVHATSDRFKDRPNVIIRRHDLTESIETLRSYRFYSDVIVKVFVLIAVYEGALNAVSRSLDPRVTVMLLC